MVGMVCNPNIQRQNWGVGGTANLRTPRTTHKTRSSSKKEVKREKEVKSISENLSGTPKFGGVRFRGERGLWDR